MRVSDKWVKDYSTGEGWDPVTKELALDLGEARAELAEAKRQLGLSGSARIAMLAYAVEQLSAALRRVRHCVSTHVGDDQLVNVLIEMIDHVLPQTETLPASISVPATTKVDAIGKQSTLCAVCDQIKELHPATHKWTAKERPAQRAGVPTTNHANLNEACQEILRVLATEKETGVEP